jgi:hypothetical protein
VAEGSDSSADGDFPYRAWAFCIYEQNGWDQLEDYVSEALVRAAGYGINTFELHDYHIGRRGIVDAAVTYEEFPKLSAKGTLNHRGEVCSRTQRSSDYERIRGMARRIKSHGLKLNAWYHVMRDAPAELEAEYPEIKDIDSGFLWKYVNALIREFFHRMPEVDRLVITSLHETPSVLRAGGNLSQKDRLLKLYGGIYDACRSAGKELVIRDFIVEYDDFASFWSILSSLPKDVYVMTKEVLADWIHLPMPLNPFLARYSGRRIIVEFDLYGEYWGRMDVPACYPEYLHTQIRNIKAFGVTGATGRVVHEDQRSSIFRTVFESPNEINCYAFAKYLRGPLPWLAKGTFTDPRERPGRWGWDLDAFDRKLWFEWAARRYGKAAAAPITRALTRTGQIIPLLFDIGGRGFQAHSHLPGVGSLPFVWEPFVDRVRALGIDFLRDEKRQAARMTRECLADVQESKPHLASRDAEQLTALFEGELLVIRAYEALLDACYELYVAQQTKNRAGLKRAAALLRKRGKDVTTSRGPKFYGAMPVTLAALAEFIEAGKTPAVVRGS